MVYRKTGASTASSTGSMVTTYDVAQAVGVSATAVSSILSGRNTVRVSEATRTRVLEAAQAMGYRRNNLAGALRTGRTNSIGIVSPLIWGEAERHLRETYLPNMLAAISVAAARVGMTAMTFLDTSLDGLSAEGLVDGRIDGIVLFGISEQTPGAAEWVRDLYATNIPCAEIGSRYGTYQIHADNFGGARAMTEHLLSLGHQKIGYCRAGNHMASAQFRQDGFVAAAEAAGRQNTCPVLESIAELPARLRGGDRITALFCYNDALALEAYRVIREAGLRVPDDISVVGFDDSPYAVAMHPELTTVLNPLTALAEAAVTLVRDQIEGVDIAECCPLVETALVIRQSAAAPP